MMPGRKSTEVTLLCALCRFLGRDVIKLKRHNESRDIMGPPPKHSKPDTGNDSGVYTDGAELAGSFVECDINREMMSQSDINDVMKETDVTTNSNNANIETEVKLSQDPKDCSNNSEMTSSMTTSRDDVMKGGDVTPNTVNTDVEHKEVATGEVEIVQSYKIKILNNDLTSSVDPFYR